MQNYLLHDVETNQKYREKITHELISKLAAARWKEMGCPSNKDAEIWDIACRESKFLFLK